MYISCTLSEILRDISQKSPIFPKSHVFDVWNFKCLIDCLVIGSVVLAQYHCVTDEQRTDRQTELLRQNRSLRSCYDDA